jgi:hypothetical protein
MFALKQIIDDPGDFIPVPPEAKHRRTEVIFLVQDVPNQRSQETSKQVLASLAGSWEGTLEREPQGEPEERLQLD